MTTLKFLCILFYTKAKKILLLSTALLRNKISFYPDFLLQFEKDYARFCKKNYALSFCNGTSAIEASLFILGLSPGDEVIVPSCTFHASIDPICNVGAKPVFVDVRRDNLTICPKDLKKKITDKTKAVMVVHLFGIPADMEEIDRIAKEAGIEVLEDVSHAHGAVAHGKMCGAWGRVGAFSLQGAKAIAAGEGGIVVTDEKSDYLKMSLWGHFNRHGGEFSEIGCEDFRHTGMGSKRRMAPLSSLLASVDLEVIHSVNAIMEKTAKKLDQALTDIPGLFIPQIPHGSRRGGFYCGYPISIDKNLGSREDAVQALHRIGIKTSSYPFESHHDLKVYRDLSYRSKLLYGKSEESVGVPAKLKLENTEQLQETLILLSRRHLVTLSGGKIKKIAEVLRNVLGGSHGA